MSGSVLHPVVQKMLDDPGVYMLGDDRAPGHAIIVHSKDGKLIVLEKDRELDPTRFTDTVVIKHGPLLP
jgi:hypothetical protein